MHYRLIFYDTETTGTRMGKDRIIEIAALDLQENKTFCSLVNPECLIPPESKEITNITDEMVQEAPKIGEALLAFADFCKEGVVLVAHNNDAFDQPFLEAEYQRAGLSMPKWLFFDTLRWARKYRPDLPRHSLQILREAYGIPPNQAHRALSDVLVLQQVFHKMVDDLPLPLLMQLVNESAKIARMPFGKHAGKPLSEIPKDYVEWLSKSGALDKKENGPLKQEFIHLGLL